MNNVQVLVSTRLQVYGISRSDSVAIGNQVQVWVSSAGSEWTVQRLKNLRMWFLHFIGGSDSVPKWIAYHKDCKEPKGPFRLLWKGYKSGRYSLQALLDAFRVYTLFVSSEATQAQKDKFYNSVNHEFSVSPDTIDHFTQHLSEHPDARRRRGDQSLVKWLYSGRRRAPVYHQGQFKTMVESDATLQEHMQYLCFMEVDEAYRKFPTVMKKLTPIMPWPLPSQDPDLRELGWTDRFHVGNVSYIQEHGMKLRAIANPARVWQYALEPLGKVLYKILSLYPEDHTFHQDIGVGIVQDWIKSGSRTYCFDLSDATNMFPRIFTEKVLKHLCPEYKEDIELWSWLCRSPWCTPDKEMITWKTGQPLGLYPSFAAFAISHHTVVRALQMRFGGNYVLLGDDIVIKGAKLAYHYRVTMNKLFGCEISLSKTLVSDKVAEFAGKLITSSEVYGTSKWSKVNDDSFLELLRTYGPRAMKLLNARQRWVATQVAPLPEPLGLGWNPGGDDLLKRLGRLFADWYLSVVGAALPVSGKKHTRRKADVRQSLSGFREHGKYPCLSDMTNYEMSRDLRDVERLKEANALLYRLRLLGFPVTENVAEIIRSNPEVSKLRVVMSSLYKRKEEYLRHVTTGPSRGLQLEMLTPLERYVVSTWSNRYRRKPTSVILQKMRLLRRRDKSYAGT